MKTTVSTLTKALFIASLLFTFFQPSFGQISGKAFDIQKPFKKTTYDGKTFKELKREGVNVTRDILKPINDPEVKKYLRISRSMIAVQMMTLLTGTIMIGVSAGRGAAGGVPGGDNMMLAGLTMLPPSIAAGIASGKMYKKAIVRYNVAVMNAPHAQRKVSPAMNMTVAF